MRGLCLHIFFLLHYKRGSPSMVQLYSITITRPYCINIRKFLLQLPKNARICLIVYSVFNEQKDQKLDFYICSLLQFNVPAVIVSSSFRHSDLQLRKGTEARAEHPINQTFHRSNLLSRLLSGISSFL